MKGTWHGQESICQPLSKWKQVRLQAHWPADRLLAPPGPIHVYQCGTHRLEILTTPLFVIQNCTQKISQVTEPLQKDEKFEIEQK